MIVITTACTCIIIVLECRFQSVTGELPIGLASTASYHFGSRPSGVFNKLINLVSKTRLLGRCFYRNIGHVQPYGIADLIRYSGVDAMGFVSACRHVIEKTSERIVLQEKSFVEPGPRDSVQVYGQIETGLMILVIDR